MMKEQQVSKEIFQLLAKRGPGKSICPSEVARNIAPDNWRAWMDLVRSVALKLAKEDEILITQKDKVLSPNQIKGPIRLRLSEKSTYFSASSTQQISEALQ